eukprot:TRINITY_DN559_c0_g1_i1.p1 TRINITY_DN559_c0_g1~~TRINITY_DN559_c0_g1_i1.p1  ORF type:complete len:210 (-),score=93.68 TRINITY_DN559_c0_g1_i1:177-806(-)
MSADKPTITYFAARGRAELARVVLASAGVQWEEVHLNPETLGELKKTDKLAFGQVPLYEDGDVTLVQSMAIARYAARKHGLMGDAKQAAYADMVIDGWNDVVNKIVPLLYPTKKEEEYQAFVNDVAPGKVADFERLVAKVLPDGGLVGGDKPVLADLALFLIAEGMVDDMEWVKKEDVPNLYALKERVAATENLAAYIASDRRHPARKP